MSKSKDSDLMAWLSQGQMGKAPLPPSTILLRPPKSQISSVGPGTMTSPSSRSLPSKSGILDQPLLGSLYSAWSSRKMTWRTNRSELEEAAKLWKDIDDADLGTTSSLDLMNSSTYSILSPGSLAKSRIFLSKTEEERVLFTKVCNEAVAVRKTEEQKAMADLQREMNLTWGPGQRILEFEQDPGLLRKKVMYDLMLKLISERDALQVQRHLRANKPKSRSHWNCAIPDLGTDSSSKEKSLVENEDSDDPLKEFPDLPLYCVNGHTILGKFDDDFVVQNSFALLNWLRDPKDDPPGFRRYCDFVNMTGFQDHEITITSCGKSLTFVGLAPNPNSPNFMKQIMESLDLPKGVFPDRLFIGRGSDGVLVIQEPWDFTHAH